MTALGGIFHVGAKKVRRGEFQSAIALVTHDEAVLRAPKLRPCGTKVVTVTDPLRKGQKVKYTKGAAIAAGTLMAMGVAAPAFADSGAQGGAANSPGVISGNNVQVPVHIPVNVCGDSIDVVGVLNPAFGNVCVND